MRAADLAEKLGLQKHANSWRGDCPACAYPRVFILRGGKQNQPSLFCANGCGRENLAHALEARLKVRWTPPDQSNPGILEAARSRNQAAAVRLWNGSTPAPGTPADRYLAKRGLSGLEASAALRYRGDCQHPEGGRYPALVAQVVDVDGRPVGCHRTYVTQDGSKAGVTPNKASLGPIWGGAVRLFPARAQLREPLNAESLVPDIVVGEGIESSASAGFIMDIPAWSALSAGNLATGLILPASVRFVVIAADNDSTTSAGQRAAGSAADRWRAEGRTVRICTPNRSGADFNDLLREQHSG